LPEGACYEKYLCLSFLLAMKNIYAFPFCLLRKIFIEIAFAFPFCLLRKIFIEGYALI